MRAAQKKAKAARVDLLNARLALALVAKNLARGPSPGLKAKLEKEKKGAVKLEAKKLKVVKATAAVVRKLLANMPS